ncbi:spore coat protein [Clostridium sp. CX1]|uniref:spore coat protein n=1 Tax=Clostridium sp. CX1 TaxID=2978346 RepID=UPI0021C0BBBC|nr:spore coat protein [Clostridium sp. CX1]MCT8978462.1 spore coat protein [Clostridium sp. CX1]
MKNQGIAPHESFELHELLTFKNVCLTKSTTMSALVTDERLKSLLQQDVTTTQGHIKELRNLMEQSSMAGSIK